MRTHQLSFLAASFLLALAAPPPGVAATSSLDARIFLRGGWELQSSCQVSATGEQISTVAFHPAGWHAATVPATVLAALVADKTFADPYFAMNLRKIPGTSYPIAKNFSKLPMPKDSPFACSWWYRTEFRLPASARGRNVWLHFNGINYRANIWLNGSQLADARDVAGAYRIFEFDATRLLVSDATNVLAVEIFAPTVDSLAVNWVDWNPAPPDKEMGLWGDVYLTASGPVAVRHPQVVTHFPNASLDRAELTVMAELHNASGGPVKGILEGEIEAARFRQEVTLEPGELRTVVFRPEEFPQLRLDHPKLWWPVLLGPQDLHRLTLRFSAGGTISDEQTIRFGIREITSELNEQGFRLFRVNGRRILIRGGGWAPDLLLRPSRKRLEAQFRYLRDMHLNALRLEGKLETDDFFDLADEQGILILAGWCCCDYWEQWGKWLPGDLGIAVESLRSQLLRLRRHPSLLVWLNGSDKHPPSDVERAYVEVLKEAAWPNPYLASASKATSSVSGPTGVKMTGPYDYVPPCYWLKDKGKRGGAFGFNTETSPGPAIPLLSSLRKMLPADHLWPIDEYWNFHAASLDFRNLNHFNKAMDAVYGKPTGLEDYLVKSQAMAYEGERAMFEAYARNKYSSTGVIQWMLNNAWPSLFWHLYDYYLLPGGGYFGTKKACEPLHVQYSYDDGSVVVVNNYGREFPGLTAAAQLYDFGLHEKFSKQVSVDAGPDSSQRVLKIPAIASGGPAQVYFLKLALQDRSGETLSSNFYWLSSKLPKFEWLLTTYKYTPVSSYPDLTRLNQLPRVRVDASATVEPGEEGPRVRVRVHNPTGRLAFQVRLAVEEADGGSEIAPVLWEDNYLALLPGESATVVARFISQHVLGDRTELRVDGWNIEPIVLPLSAPAVAAPQKQSER